MGDIVVNITTPPSIVVEITPIPVNTVALSIGAPGLTGQPGAKGSDASVTSANISSALGFAPVSPSALDTAIAALSSVYQTASQVASQIASALTTYATQSWVSTAISNAISSLGLGSASTHPASDFATATQGAKADTALQDPSAFDPAGSAAAAASASIPLTQKGAANGVATLGSDSRIPAAQLPSYMDLVEEFASFSALPATGATGTIYVTKDTNKIYRWSGSTYVEISPSPGSTDSVTEGSVNFYFTAARAVSALASTLASYATQAWVAAQNYATQSWVSSAISSAIAALGLGTASTHAATDFDSAGAATSAQANSKSYTDTAIAALSSIYQNAAQVSSAITTALTGYATQSWVTAQNYLTSVSWGIITGKPSSFTPSAHASTHASAGSDPLTLSSSQITGLGTAATQNSTAFDSAGAASTAQSYAIQRANHTGTQPASTVTGIAKQVFQGFSVSTFDTSIPTFSGGVLTLFTLKSGGASGTITNTVAYNYSGGLLTSKVLKDPSGAVLNTITFSYSGSTLTSKVLT